MKTVDFSLNLVDFARRVCKRGVIGTLPAAVAAIILANAPSADAALSFIRGTPTAVGPVRFSSSPDSVLITGALTGPGVITLALAIPANRVQYDIIASDQGNMPSWTIFYGPAVGPKMLGAYTPLGYIAANGTDVPEGGVAYTTLFNAGYGVYTYNTGAPWTIDYEPDHITFSAPAGSPGLPANDGEGELNPSPYLPSFGILYDPSLADGLVAANAMVGTTTLSGQVLGPVPGITCPLYIRTANVTVETCSNCAPVTFPNVVFDQCCSNAVVTYNPPSGTCFPVGTTTTVVATASDACGNKATNHFTVTVNHGPNCPPTNCISINASNIVTYTCNPCTPVLFNATATDRCCPTGGNVTLVYNPPTNTCFPLNSTTPVTITAFDQCGNTNSTTITVTVLPGPTCGNTNCITINASNIVAYTCQSCTPVPFNVTAFDQCCSAGGLTVVYSVPTNTCFPLNTVTPVQITATDNCGNSATKFITVSILPAAGCGGNSNCIYITASNIVAFTCTNCTMVPFNATAYDPCCAAGATLVYNPPTNTCFPANSVTPVQITAIDPCGNTTTKVITVTVLRGPNCPPDLTISGGTPGSPLTITWPAPNATLQQSMDMSNWTAVPYGTNSPFVVSNTGTMNFFRLQYH